MKINNPKVTLKNGFLDWLFTSIVKGEDGEFYEVGGSILSMNTENIDLVTMTLSKGKGYSKQLTNSIYRVGVYPGALYRKHFHKADGTLNIEAKEDSAVITCGTYYKVECSSDNSWHIMINSGDGEFSADLIHTPYGYPLWYGREIPSPLTRHSVTYAYNWAGDVNGTFTYKGKTTKVKGTGQRERYIAVDSSAAELGGWEDWGFITFNEFHSSFYGMRLGMKDLSLYDIINKKHYPEGNLTIAHENWVFIRELDGFVPKNYNIKIEVEDGIYEVKAHTCNVRCWGVTFKVPDMPVATLLFDNVEGTFTYKDGRVINLTGGNGELSIRQWHEYPRILPRELYVDEEPSSSDKFSTL